MQTIADVSKILKTVLHNLLFILNVLSESSIHFTQLSIVLAKRNVAIFTENSFYRKRGCVTLRNYAGTCNGICNYNLIYNVLIQLLPLKSLVFVMRLLNAFWHGNERFPKISSEDKIVPLLVVFLFPYSKYKGVKICFYQCRYQNQNFSHMSHSCHYCSIGIAVVSFVQHSCYTCVGLVLLVSHLSRTHVAFVSLASHSCRWCLALVS